MNMKFDPLYYPYNSRRNVVYSKQGMVATSHPLAAQAGLEILRAGGNAIDAALATAISLTVLEPTSNGIGGDAFALIWSGGELHGLNASGPAPESISVAQVKERGFKDMPARGWLPVTVPGAPSGWIAASERFGRLPFLQLFQPAIKYARDGFPVPAEVGRNWQRALAIFKEGLRGEEYKPWFDTFAPGGKAPGPGDVWNCEDMAQTLSKIGETDAEAFYHGELAEKICNFSRQHGGFLRGEDLAEYQAQWVEPLKSEYRGYSVWELPPNGQGLVVLMALNILGLLDVKTSDPVENYHLQIEALKLAFSQGKEHITDPDYMIADPRDLLSAENTRQKRELIGYEALNPEAKKPSSGGTVYLASADGEGNMVSYIQSNFMGFGSGLVVPETGIALQNRGATFSLEQNSINCLAPGKKTYHTIIPGFLTRNNEAVGPFGVMGGYMQPQGHLQVLVQTLDYQENPQTALDAPRWQWLGGRRIAVEADFPQEIALALKRRGHEVEKFLEKGSFGRGQIIWRNQQGVLVGATDPRADGQVAAW